MTDNTPTSSDQLLARIKTRPDALLYISASSIPTLSGKIRVAIGGRLFPDPFVIELPPMSAKRTIRKLVGDTQIALSNRRPDIPVDESSLEAQLAQADSLIDAAIAELEGRLDV